MLIYFPDYKLYAGDTEITHEKIMGFAKCWYCVEQAFQRYDLSYAMWDTVYNTNYCNEKTPEPKNGRNFSFDELNAMTAKNIPLTILLNIIASNTATTASRHIATTQPN